MKTDRSFLGTGWSFPPTFLRETASVVMVSDDLDIQESLHILLSTSRGERILLPDYGCDLLRRVFQGMTTSLRTEIATRVRQAIVNWEPRVEVLEVQVLPDASVAGLLQISVGYRIRTTNTRSNLVYPFYFQEGTLVPAS
jgi:phage baseplate assembly protein W